MNDVLAPVDLVKTAQRAYESGDYPAAARSFLAAAQGYQARGEALTAAEMQNNASVAWLQHGDGAAALKAVEGTPQIFAAAGDLRRQGMALGNLAAALEGTRQLEEAAEVYQQAADVLKQAGEGELRAHTLKALSVLQLRSGKQLLALATMQAGVDGIEKPSLREKALKKLLKLPFYFIGK